MQLAKGYNETFERLKGLLGHMPGVGEKTAERLAYHILRLPEAEAFELADAIRDVKKRVRQCSICYHFSEQDPCAICSDPARDHSTICVVEQSQDVLSMEQSGYRGLYHVLGGRLAPLEGMGPDDLTVGALIGRIAGGQAQEVILACNPDMEGEATALFVSEALEGLPVRLTRLARGIPAGSHLEYANASVLGDALEGRREVQRQSDSTENGGDSQ